MSLATVLPVPARAGTAPDSPAAATRLAVPTAIVSVRQAVKRYPLGQGFVQALGGVDLEIAPHAFMAIWGPSGSGKSSLLNLVGLIDTPSEGCVLLAGEDTRGLDDDALAARRNRSIGFVFQGFNLVPVLDACENVMLPLQIRGVPAREARERAAERLAEVGLAGQGRQRPDQLSGGQRQRVAIARALVGAPQLVIADEPTANLDSETSRVIIDLMRSLNERQGVSFVFSTHDPRLLARVDSQLELRDGLVVAGPEPR